LFPLPSSLPLLMVGRGGILLSIKPSKMSIQIVFVPWLKLVLKRPSETMSPLFFLWCLAQTSLSSLGLLSHQDGFSTYDLCGSRHIKRLLYLTVLEVSPLHGACVSGNEDKLAQQLLDELLDINQRSVVSLVHLPSPRFPLLCHFVLFVSSMR
jgi:hypothetical protein